ncbi:InlB B-repeat-containing protein [Myxococcota bacterium]|nr:InlB B-repeat-containing protein [Myxococcota bacterium]
MKIRTLILWFSMLLPLGALFACDDSSGTGGKARWAVTYDGNGHTSGEVPVDERRYATFDEIFVRAGVGLAREGFVFGGWLTTASGTLETVHPGEILVMGGADVVLTARWMQTVTYDGNGASGGLPPTDDHTYETGDTVIVPGNPGGLRLDGASFAGWCVNADGTGESYTTGDVFSMGESSVVLYAKWTTNPTYRITYHGNSNTGGVVPADGTAYEAGALVTVLPNSGSLVKDGYALAGWNERTDGTGFTYAPGQVMVMPAANVVLYAKWTADPTFTVAYSGNGNTGGTAPVDGLHYETGDNVRVAGNPGNLVRDGHTFAGWCLDPDGLGAVYAEGDLIPMGSDDLVLFAKWTANTTFRVIYDGNGNTGGSVPVDALHYETGDTVRVLGNGGGLVQDGFSFVGWNTAADGTGTTYTFGQTFAMGGGDVTLFARWTSNPTWTVTYDGNGNDGGAVPVDATNYEQGQMVTVLGNTGNLVRTGFTFVGWCSTADGTGYTYLPGQQLPMGTAPVQLFAKWTSNPTYVVMYNGNLDTGGSVPVDPNNYELGSDVTVLGNTGNLVRAGYSFGGWCMDPDCLDVVYQADDTFLMGAANLVLYAYWVPVPVYTVTYDGNGDTGGAVPVDGASYIEGAPVTVEGNPGGLVTDLQQDGITLVFFGWNTQADGSGVTYLPGDTFPMGAGDTTLHVVWSVIRATGPAGGLIFHDKGDTLDGWRYLEAAPVDQGTQVQWFNGVYVDTGTTAKGIGAGAPNTAAIVLAQGVPVPVGHTYAAQLCDDLVFGGFDDWFLPSMDELYWMHYYLKRSDLGGFSDNGYWSSSQFEFDVRFARNQYFLTGGQGYDPKDWTNDVRAVRAFLSF